VARAYGPIGGPITFLCCGSSSRTRTFNQSSAGVRDNNKRSRTEQLQLEWLAIAPPGHQGFQKLQQRLPNNQGRPLRLRQSLLEWEVIHRCGEGLHSFTFKVPQLKFSFIMAVRVFEVTD
jgi:hypothetical protein